MSAAPAFDAARVAAVLDARERALRREIDVKRGQAARPTKDVTDQQEDASATTLDDVTAREIQRDIAELREIEAARQRLDNGRYGECVDCGEPIGAERLAAQPTAVRCTACQAKLEQRHSAAH